MSLNFWAVREEGQLRKLMHGLEALRDYHRQVASNPGYVETVAFGTVRN